MARDPEGMTKMWDRAAAVVRREMDDFCRASKAGATPEEHSDRLIDIMRRHNTAVLRIIEGASTEGSEQNPVNSVQ
jgi:hypothetical protein